MRTPPLARFAGKPDGPKVVGRRGERATIRGVLNAVLAGEGATLTFVGEAGIGKTLLLDDLAASAASQGALVLRGRVAEFERDLPYGPYLEALVGFPHGLDGLAEPTLRHVAHRAVWELLATQAAERPTVLILDDLHWADRASVDLTAALLRRSPCARLLIALAYRPHQGGAAILPPEWAASSASRHLTLGPVELGDTAEIVDRPLTAAEATAIHEACGGNPFYLQLLGRRRSQRIPELVRSADGLADEASAAALLASELEPLSPAATHLAQAAAIAGDPWDVWLAAAIAGPALNGSEPAEAVAELRAANLIRTDRVDGRFAFRHPLVRHGILRSTGPGWQLAAHARAADALRRRGVDGLALAHHVEHSAAPGDRDAIDLLTRAGHHVAPLSPASAAHWLEAAWNLVPHDERAVPPNPDLLSALALALTLSGQGERALVLTQAAVAAFPDSHPARILFDLGHAAIESMAGRIAEARARLRALLGRLPEGASVDRFKGNMALAILESSTGNPATARRHVDHALHTAENLKLASLQTAARAASAWVACVGEDLTTAITDRDRAAAEFSELDDTAITALPVAFAALARATHWLDRFDEAQRLATRGLTATRGGSWPILVTQFLALQAISDTSRGEVAAALDAADAAAEQAALLDNSESRFWAQLARAVALEPTGDTAGSVSAAERAVREGREARYPQMPAVAGQALAQALLAADLPDQAMSVLRAAHEHADLAALPNVFNARRATTALLWTLAELAQDNEEAAQVWTDRARGFADANGLPMSRSHADLAAAHCALRGGDLPAAAAHAAAAAAHARGCGARLEAARAELVQGKALAAASDRVGGASCIRAAEAQFAAGGATRLQAEAARELRALGLRVTREGRDRSAGTCEPLTARQREIAALVAAGQTNAEIAAELFLSKRTVETHLSAVLRKTGVASRREFIDRTAAAS